MELRIIDYGLIDYEECLEIQRKLQSKRIDGKIKDTLMVLEHRHVLTKGKRAKKENILLSKEGLNQKDIRVIEVERGGDVTYHGPGQLVIYPIINLVSSNIGVREYIDMLQTVVINVLEKHFNIFATKRSGEQTGVWVDNNKIAAIGVSINSGVTMHGVAFNINTDLSGMFQTLCILQNGCNQNNQD